MANAFQGFFLWRAALASFIPIGKVLKIPKAIDKIVDSNVGEVVKKSDVDEVVGKGADKNKIRLLPPLNISKKDLEKAIGILSEVLK